MNRFVTSIALIVFGLSLLATAHRMAAETYDVYILTGQSNALGTTRFDGDEAEDYGPGESKSDETVSLFWSNVHAANRVYPPRLYGDSGGKIVPLTMQQGDEAKNPRFWGPEFGFARVITEQTNNKVLIIKVTRGGGGNSLWDKTVFEKEKDAGHMWQHLCDTVNDGLGLLAERDDTFQIKGLIYIQGESNRPDEARLSKERLKNLYDNLREHINTSHRGTADAMKLVVGEIAASQRNTTSRVTTKLQKELSDDHIDFVFVSTRDLPLQPDGIHFGKKAKLAIGKSIGEAFAGFELIEE